MVLLLAAAEAALDRSLTTDHAPTRQTAGGGRPLYEQTPGHRRMLELLRGHPGPGARGALLAQRSKGARAQGARCEASDADAPDFDRFELSLNLGEAEQRLGREQEAIDNAVAGLRAAAEGGARPRRRHRASGHLQPRVRLHALGRDPELRARPQRRELPSSDSGRRGSPAPGRIPESHRSTSRKCMTRAAEEHARVSLRALASQHRLHDRRRLSRRSSGGVSDSARELRFRRAVPAVSRTSRAARASTPSTSRAGVVVDDFDYDGYLDLLVSTLRSRRADLRLFLNDRDGTFRERTREAGLTGNPRRAQHGPGGLRQRRRRGRSDAPGRVDGEAPAATRSRFSGTTETVRSPTSPSTPAWERCCNPSQTAFLGRFRQRRRPRPVRGDREQSGLEGSLAALRESRRGDVRGDRASAAGVRTITGPRA